VKNRKSIFFTSDWHIGHANSIIFDKRPFNGLEHMHSSLIKNYNAQVPENGVCYFLGDIGVGSAETCKEVMSKLNGTKVLVLGNHDRAMNSMYGMGFDVVLTEAAIWIQGERVTMTHCPLRGLFREDVTNMRGAVEGQNWHGEHKQIMFSIENQGQFHLHGHIHSPNGGKSQKILGRQFDVGLPANGYRPVSISVIESWIVKTKQEENNERAFK
jgi:calcineurin-like phosphoesterase family protein